MTTIKLEMLNNIPITLINGDTLIWITHDKNYKYGWYYKIHNNKLFLVYDTEITYEEHLIKDLGDNNDKI